MAGLLETRAVRGNYADAASADTESERIDMWTSMPGRIVKFDPENQTATVKVLYKPKLAGKATEIPDLLGVPVMFPRGGGAALTWPVKEGDGVQLSFQSRNMDAWYEKGEAAEADTARMHDLSDAVAHLGMEPSTKKLANFNNEHTQLRSEDGKNAFTFDQKNGKFKMTGAGGKYDLFTIVESMLDFLAKDKLNGAGTGPQGGLEYQQQFAELKSHLGQIKL
ncbi:hypothetical protein PMNALOAF_1266 [Methylobacterium adhaesivum]|uniref:Gp138 family membrane-puncturing spike protein n=1 Tax=Methylobacterium adhaesivum TaxID=333297 RepID=A0ABT8BGT2_9HYPH|nr:Gp138 family membrane-puncturing spike protein [Methylobacterium adhaesivum]MDN3590591.1 Gp138 family membrane-puncturing spike protein [Methylobacterium adhaesivum]GJD30023.1 hypothetical protein PMNALOAF_1266 [Methylobacterium adhaesivum]